MQKYCIVDVETTGANRQGQKVTEIAIIVTDGRNILEEFSSLINPERRIPIRITYLTGITNEMVAEAPKFYEIAKILTNFYSFFLFLPLFYEPIKLPESCARYIVRFQIY